MNVLVVCEYSGRVRDEFIKKGHYAVSVDLLPTELPGNHIQTDIWVNNQLKLPRGDWDLMIAHPPCTYLANSGVRWLYSQPGRWDLMRDAACLFQSLLNSAIPKIAVENPVMHGHTGIRKPDFSIQPWQFGHGEVKRTCFWTKNLQVLTPTKIVEGRYPKCHRTPPSKNRGKIRSLTYPGIAEAIANQWGVP